MDTTSFTTRLIARFRIVRRIIAVIAIVGIVAAIILSHTSSPKSEAPNEVTIGIATFAGYAPLYIAESKGYYGDTKVNFVTIESLPELRSALASGAIEGYMMTYDMFQSVRDEAPNAIAILAVDESRGADGVVAPTSIQKPEDLRGVTVGAEMGFPPYLLLLSFLDNAGMTMSDLKFTDIPSANVAAAFISKSITVGGTYEPYLSEIVKRSTDTHLLLSSKNTPGLISDLLFVTPKTLSEKKPALVNIVRGYARAVNDIKASPRESLAIAAPRFGLSTDDLVAMKDGIIWPDEKYSLELFSKDSKTNAFTSFEYVGKILRANNETNITLDADDHITDEIVRAAFGEK